MHASIITYVQYIWFYGALKMENQKQQISTISYFFILESICEIARKFAKFTSKLLFLTIQFGSDLWQQINKVISLWKMTKEGLVVSLLWRNYQRKLVNPKILAENSRYKVQQLVEELKVQKIFESSFEVWLEKT